LSPPEWYGGETESDSCELETAALWRVDADEKLEVELSVRRGGADGAARWLRWR
jgi:hypothetical protein